jgi:hypothetical protein
MIKILLLIGFVSRNTDGKIDWPFRIPPKHVFSDFKSFICYCRFFGPFYIFRNKPGVIKWIPGRLLPRRWGFGIYGFEFGDRGH